MKPANPGTRRREARSIIMQVIEDHVHGPVQTLPREDVLELRRILRDAYPYGEKKHWPYKVWCEEVRSALGFPDPKPRPYKKKPFRVASHNIMPSMREWAKERGILVEETAPA